MTDNMQAQSSCLPIASLMLAIIGCLVPEGAVVIGPFALVLGIVALDQIKRTTKNPRSYALAIAGIAVSIIGFVLFFSCLYSYARLKHHPHATSAISSASLSHPQQIRALS